MSEEKYSIQAQIVENGKSIKGTLALYSDRYEFNGMRKTINWEKVVCVRGTTKVKSFIFSSEKNMWFLLKVKNLAQLLS